MNMKWNETQVVSPQPTTTIEGDKQRQATMSGNGYGLVVDVVVILC